MGAWPKRVQFLWLGIKVGRARHGGLWWGSRGGWWETGEQTDPLHLSKTSVQHSLKRQGAGFGPSKQWWAKDIP